MMFPRYREARTLVRRLCRMPEEDPAAFKQKIARLRRHFEQFNVDVSELCQWLMGMRKAHGDQDHPASFGVLGDSLLEPGLPGIQPDETELDRWRLAVFDAVTGVRADVVLGSEAAPEPLRLAIQDVAQAPRTALVQELFDRMQRKEPAHRLVLLKAAAEWIVARYRRGMENWKRQREEWEKEKEAWEKQHAALTDSVRQGHTNIFKNLRDPEEEGKVGVRRKNPRICPHARLQQNLNNCIYAGQKGHGPLCWKYVEFVKAQKAQDKGFKDKLFWEDADKLIKYCAEKRIKPANAFQSPALPGILFKDLAAEGGRRAVEWLKRNWSAYFKFMEVNADTLVQRGQLPHCRKIGKTWEETECRWNPHTELCLQYGRAVGQLDAEALKLEPLYREWRKNYLAGPRKPSFKYPSSRDLPMPKIFGAGFQEIDFDRSVMRLRLDDMPVGEWIEFGFIPWPRGYHPSRSEIKGKITSVHINFLGMRARAGLRFDVPRKESRFTCEQDELDELRSRQFPRQAQDELFLEAARKRLVETFAGNADSELRLLAVDLGEVVGVHAAAYQGRKHERDMALEVLKIDTHYADWPSTLKKDSRQRPVPVFDHKTDKRGLRKEHVGQHLEGIAKGATKIAEHRQQGAGSLQTLGEHDFRGLKRHIAWMIRDWARHTAAQIIAVAEGQRSDLIVFESMRGFRAPGYEVMDPDKKRRLAMFAFGRVRHKVAEKAVERGMRVVTAPYFKSSQVCSACGKAQENMGLWRKNKGGRRFKCEHCKAELNSDANAARVLARVFWGEIHLPTPT